MGSRGDFEPFLNFAIEAQKLGHDVTLATTSDFVERSSSAGIETITFQGSFLDVIQDSGVSPVKAMKDFSSKVKPLMTAAFQKVSDAVQEMRPDVVVYHPKVLSAPLAAKKVQAKSVVVELAPLITPTKEFGAAGIGSGNLGPFNQLSYKLVSQSEALFKKELKALSASLGVEMTVPDYSLCLVSPTLLTRPRDWPETTQLVGPWAPREVSTKEDPRVLDFIRQAQTVYFGFGSMAIGNARRRAEMSISAAQACGMQALLVTGWGGLEPHSDSKGYMAVKAVNHSEVFSRVAVAVHHGGAGTVHSALRAGTPSVIVPFIADQPWWGALLARQGLGPNPIPERKVTERALVAAIKEATTFKDRVVEASQKMTLENGISQTIMLLEKWVSDSNS